MFKIHFILSILVPFQKGYEIVTVYGLKRPSGCLTPLMLFKRGLTALTGFLRQGLYCISTVCVFADSFFLKSLLILNSIRKKTEVQLVAS
jgi:hypothetical protein